MGFYKITYWFFIYKLIDQLVYKIKNEFSPMRIHPIYRSYRTLHIQVYTIFSQKSNLNKLV